MIVARTKNLIANESLQNQNRIATDYAIDRMRQLHENYTNKYNALTVLWR